MRSALYARVSTEEQLEGYSIDAQRRNYHLLVQSRGWESVAEYIDEGNGGMGWLRGWAFIEERTLWDAFVKRQKPVVHYGVTLEPSTDIVIENLLEQWEIRKDLKKKTLFRIGGKDYKDGEWSCIMQPYSPEIRARLIDQYQATKFRADDLNSLVA